MEASKVTISHETRARISNPALSPTKKRELRECLIKDRIRSSVNKVFTKQELIAIAGFDPSAESKEYPNGLTLIRSMIKRGVIGHEPTNNYRKTWFVVEDKKDKRVPRVTPTAQEVAKTVVELKDYKHVTSMELKDMAKEFAWRENSDSLREFIAYVDNAIK